MPKFKWYYVIFALPIYLVASLPMPLVYFISDFLRLIVYYILGYRKKVVFENLRNSFPDKSEQWLKQTAHDFYKNLFDTIVETLVMATASKSFYLKRHTFINKELLDGYYKQNRSVILVCGHLANWEWAGQATLVSGLQLDVLYHPLSSKFFDWFMYHIRTRYNLHLISMQNTLREMVSRKNIPSVITFIADQTPSAENAHWMQFMNQDTPVFLGVEKMARKFNYPVVYGDMIRLKRGYYSIEFKLLFEEPKATADFEITESHMRHLEESILETPADWLWSHRRWKHTRK
ncbi:MAG: lipid A biosynthesis acyltransferase [Bacteroidetes bacterium B1(2017)]|nr:MAG: lipid A biosynthesis acyltransferase [Bacteroidetes bacterium B1(2017)]